MTKLAHIKCMYFGHVMTDDRVVKLALVCHALYNSKGNLQEILTNRPKFHENSEISGISGQLGPQGVVGRGQHPGWSGRNYQECKKLEIVLTLAQRDGKPGL